MKQQVIRRTLTGDWEAFTFNVSARAFFVKNFTDGDIYVSFEADDVEAESFKIKSGIGEGISINDGVSTSAYYKNTVYVKGTGEVEVEATDF